MKVAILLIYAVLRNGSQFENLWTRRNDRALSVHVISRKALKEFAQKQPRSEAPLDVWYRFTRTARWTSIAEVRNDFPHADIVGRCIVFNIAGNHYRLIAEINFKSQTVFVRAVLTHKEYDSDRWKDGC